MKKKKNPIILGVGALAVLCAVYAGVTVYGKHADREKERKEEESQVWLTDIPEVTGISYKNQDGELSFVKEGGTWYYEGDREFPLQQYRLTSLAAEAGKLKAVRQLAGGDSLEQYGLADPERSVTVTGADGTSKTILVGSPVSEETGANYYAIIEGETTAATISATLPEDLGRGLYDLIELEKLPAIKGEDVRELTITKGQESKTFVKDSGDNDGNVSWYRDATGSDANKLEDNSIPNALADGLSQLTIASCQNYKADQAAFIQYGLDAPQAVIQYSYEKDGEKGSVRLEIGKTDESGTNYYTRKDDSRAVNLMSKELVDKCLND